MIKNHNVRISIICIFLTSFLKIIMCNLNQEISNFQIQSHVINEYNKKEFQSNIEKIMIGLINGCVPLNSDEWSASFEKKLEYNFDKKPIDRMCNYWGKYNIEFNNFILAQMANDTHRRMFSYHFAKLIQSLSGKFKLTNTFWELEMSIKFNSW